MSLAGPFRLIIRPTKRTRHFKQKYGQDGNLLVIGIQTPELFKEKIFNDYVHLQQELKNVTGVTDIISVPSAVNLVKDSATEKLNASSHISTKKT